MTAKTKTPAYSVPKFPRVMVSAKRHALLAKEAGKAKLSIAQLLEKKLGGK